MTGRVRSCPLCDAKEAQLLHTSDLQSPAGEPYRVVACVECGMRYTHPMPTAAELDRYYGDDYYVQNKPRLLSADLFRLLFQRSVLWKHRRALLGRRPGRILDHGCGNGDFLADLSSRGWRAYGVEYSEAACKIARAKGATVHQGDLSGARFPAGSFDVVTLWHVLEHLPYPRAEIAEIGRLLRDDGLLIIEVPNSDSVTFRICGLHWYPLDVPVHLQHFTAETLRRMLKTCGFVPVHCSSFHHWDFTYTFYSYMDWLGVLKRLRIRVYSADDYKQASVVSKLAFLAVGVPVAIFAFVQWMLSLVWTGTGESVTMVFEQVRQ